MENNLKKLEQTIGYQFTAKSLLEQAMTHSSYANEKHLGKLGCNERLEFLGDAVLELISSDFLYKKFRNNQEGELTKKRASMVCEKSLAYCAREFGLPEFILLGRGEEMMGGRKRDSIVSDALESLIGAMYLDGGFEPAQAFVMKFILNDLEDKRIFYDSKTVIPMYSIMPIMSLVMEINGPVAMAGSTFSFSKVMGTSVPKMEANMTTAKRLMETE